MFSQNKWEKLGRMGFPISKHSMLSHSKILEKKRIIIDTFKGIFINWNAHSGKKKSKAGPVKGDLNVLLL